MRVVGACTCNRSVFGKRDVGQSTLCMGCLRSHHFYYISECLVLSCLCPCPCLFLGGWCELVCACTRERGGFLFGVGWVF